MAGDRVKRGRQARSEVMGKDVIDGVLGRAGEMELVQQDLYMAHAWCDVFQREGLPRTTRLLINIAILSVLGEREVLKNHVRAAIRVGCTQAEIRETLMQAGTIGGGIRAVLACRAADEALRKNPASKGGYSRGSESG
jgi:4-carboxymuconolactone decarboxylase